MGWLKKMLIKMAVKQLDGLKPIIAAKVKQAQAELNNISPEGFASELVDEIEDAILTKVGIPKEDR